MLARGAKAVGEGPGKVAGWPARRPGEAECAGCMRRNGINFALGPH